MSGKDCCKVAEGFYVGRAERDERSKQFMRLCRDRFVVLQVVTRAQSISQAWESTTGVGSAEMTSETTSEGLRSLAKELGIPAADSTAMNRQELAAAVEQKLVEADLLSEMPQDPAVPEQEKELAKNAASLDRMEALILKASRK